MASVALAQKQQANAGGFPCLTANLLSLGQDAGGVSMVAKGSCFLQENLVVSNIIQTKGLAISYRASDPDGPTSSFNAETATEFNLGTDYTWAVTGNPAVYAWTSAAGTGGESVITLPSSAEEGLILVQKRGAIGSPAGILSVTDITTSSFTVSSLDSAGALVTTDVGRFGWIIINPNFGT